MEKTILHQYLSEIIARVSPTMSPFVDTMAEAADIALMSPHILLEPPEESNGRQAVCVMEGVVRGFYWYDEHTDITVQLLAEGSIIPRTSGYKEFFPNQSYHYETLTPVKLAVWEASNLDHLALQIPNWWPFVLNLNNYLLVKSSLRHQEMLHDDATTRYKKFLKRHPDILERVQLRHIASYLGIAPQSLSRIRQQFSNAT